METPLSSSLQSAVLAGGCFWCLEAVFEQVRALLNPDGLSATLAGYRVKRISGEVRGIQMDKDTPKDAYGFRPYFAVDAYRLVKEV